MIRLAQPIQPEADAAHTLVARPMGIDTYQEPVIYMRADCPVCRSEGFESQSRVRVSASDRSVIATLNIVRGDLLDHGEVGLSEAAWTLLGATGASAVTLSHPDPVESFRHVRAKLFGHTLSSTQLGEIVDDVARSRYSDVQLSAFLAGCIGERMSRDEIVALTRAMVDAGDRLEWSHPLVYDKHCVGGLPGNRTTPLVVAIVTACGVVMPKTSSRAITSPAGTADAMETLAPVDLSLAAMRRVVEQEGGCIVWGGAVGLSPADDVLIRVERALDVDSEAQLVASVLSKKIAAGATHALIDIPIGPTAKVRDDVAAERLSMALRFTGAELGLGVEVLATDGTQPVGQGIGPALEARDVLSVLQRQADAPTDLRERAVLLAGRILERAGCTDVGDGTHLALQVLDDGRAWRKFQAICEAQGGLRTPPSAAHRCDVVADGAGRVTAIDNRILAKVAKLAGAPSAPAAGLDLQLRIGDGVERDQPLMTVHAESSGELAYALRYLTQHPDIVTITPSEEAPS